MGARNKTRRSARKRVFARAVILGGQAAKDALEGSCDPCVGYAITALVRASRS